MQYIYQYIYYQQYIYLLILHAVYLSVYLSRAVYLSTNIYQYIDQQQLRVDIRDLL